MLHQSFSPASPAPACDLSATIPDTFTPAFLNAVLLCVARRKVHLHANPVSTREDAGLFLRIQNRRTEMTRLQGIILNAAKLLEPWEHDLLDLEIAASELAFDLDIDGMSGALIERDALAIVRGEGA